ncbi:ceramide glucosyltransferase-like isoform X1 [Biomphalaria glabrata]|uniref:ceramide glucosyltransferase n=2 Tax=Biomphalaria glabrata TaxID=6526 RepID=A0A9W3ACC8_BIOGL|nr:ceramide glucosyltransferase-like isoform X1 [Biomphalaria glabrata]XP_055884854.1 ceramide glucosyltransferase-like isoform X1 [Biomphalaria glabrata]KAI8754622.1 ceramide glucosyltransferase [Biomphalaria glabrata]KAI8773252.1 ceramide glucosyltransferase [Biomphalaria glabrata]
MEPAEYVIFGLCIVLFVGFIVNLLIHILAIFYGKWKLSRKLSPPVVEDLPGISIIKPLVGVDPNLFDNLETYFNFKYPQYEILFCIQDELDSVIMIAQSLILKYPKVDAKIFIGDTESKGKKNVGVNPKINNMIRGYEAAKYDLFLISDSSIKMKEDTLMDMALHMTEKIGLVQQMPFVCDRPGFVSHLEKIFFGTHHGKMYLVANFLGINCASGMSTLFRKEIIEEAGGLAHFGKYLAEDYMLAQAVLDRGYKVLLCSQTALQNSGYTSLTTFHDRLIRWTKLRNATVVTTMFFEPIYQCIVQGLIMAFVTEYLFSWSPLVFFMVHVLIWFLLDYILLSIIQQGPLPFSKFEFLVGWILNEISYPILVCRAHWDPIITWRSRKYKIRWGGITTEVTSAPPSQSK